jgi:hypothetical protein
LQSWTSLSRVRDSFSDAFSFEYFPGKIRFIEF